MDVSVLFCHCHCILLSFLLSFRGSKGVEKEGGREGRGMTDRAAVLDMVLVVVAVLAEAGGVGLAGLLKGQYRTKVLRGICSTVN